VNAAQTSFRVAPEHDRVGGRFAQRPTRAVSFYGSPARALRCVTEGPHEQGTPRPVRGPTEGRRPKRSGARDRDRTARRVGNSIARLGHLRVRQRQTGRLRPSRADCDQTGARYQLVEVIPAQTVFSLTPSTGSRGAVPRERAEDCEPCRVMNAKNQSVGAMLSVGLGMAVVRVRSVTGRHLIGAPAGCTARCR